MQIEVTNSFATHNAGAVIADGPVLPMPYSRTGKEYRVEAVHIRYTLSSTGSWEIANQFAITLSGTVLKKDGTESKNGTKGNPGNDWAESGEWAWLGVLVDELRPVGSPALACPDRFEISEEG